MDATRVNLEQTLAKELKLFRALIEEQARFFARNSRDRVEELLNALKRTSKPAGKPFMLEAKEIEKILNKIAKSKVRPSRGRVKDLKKLQDLLDFIHESINGAE